MKPSNEQILRENIEYAIGQIERGAPDSAREWLERALADTAPASAPQIPNFTPGTVYQSRRYGPLVFVGIDNFCGQSTYQFKEGQRDRYLLPDVIAGEFGALSATAPESAPADAQDLLNDLANVGGKIVRTASLDEVQIAVARIEKRMFVRTDGCGFVHMPPARNPLATALPFAILDVEMAALERFHECATDGEGYDVAKPMMQRLACIGLVRRVTANYYEHTNFGLSVLNGEFATHPAPSQTADQVRDAALAEAIACVPGGSICDPQQVADAIHAIKSSPASSPTEGANQARELTELRRLAEEATGGPWVHRFDPGNPKGVQHGVKLEGEFGAWICDCLDNADKRVGAIAAGDRNAQFIAAANPAAILRLLDRLVTSSAEKRVSDD
jgi:hypothetical protein